MINPEGGNCEFCGNYSEITASTSFYGHYCAGCIKLVIFESKEALNEIKKQKQANKNLAK